MSKKRTLEGFFKPTAAQSNAKAPGDQPPPSRHPTYPFPIAALPSHITDLLAFAPAEEGRFINDQPDLDLVYYQPYVPKDVQRELFTFLRRELPFYRVRYTIRRGPTETPINTPRFTTVFGVDETACFGADGTLLDRQTRRPAPGGRYGCAPRPIPSCLDRLRALTEGTTGERFNFCLVNYYATGADSISYHSDDERFLGADPAIASFTLGARRDFLMKHKRAAELGTRRLKLPLGSGDMVLMRGRTQAHWLHSVPKRKGGEADRGRINITFRRAMVKGGTDNYYQYNVGSGPVMRWDEERGEMVEWKNEGEAEGKRFKAEEDGQVKEADRDGKGGSLEEKRTGESNEEDV